MKHFYALIFLLTTFSAFSQTLPINFEGDVTTSNFVDFDGGTATVVTNPFKSPLNSSNTVAKIIRDGGKPWAGSKILLDNNLDFSVMTKITMKVYSSAPIGTTVKFKLEGSGASAEVDAFTTVKNEWETLEWIFAGTANDLNEVVFMLDYGNIGDGSPTSTFYFDDVKQVTGPPAPIPTALPINFENSVVSSDFIDFSGATATVIANPQKNGINTSNTVCQVVKESGEFWAGSKILLANNLDLSTMWHISMKVYTTAPVGTRIKLELEGAAGKTNLDYLTTGSGNWETASWNFDGLTDDYNKITFMFDYGNVGDGTANSTFLFDDVTQFIGDAIPDPIATSLPEDFENGVVTSDFTNFSGAVTTIIANPHINSNNPSATVGKFVRSGGAPWAQSKLLLTDFLDFSSLSSLSMKVYTDAPVGTLLKFKVESSGFANEKDTYTTVSGDWETYYWDFANDPPVYNTITLMLGYATPNNASANATFLFDDIKQEKSILSTNNDTFTNNGISVFPNPVNDEINFVIKGDSKIIQMEIFSILSSKIYQIKNINFESNSAQKIDASNFPKGVYFLKTEFDDGKIITKKILKL